MINNNNHPDIDRKSNFLYTLFERCNTNMQLFVSGLGYFSFPVSVSNSYLAQKLYLRHFSLSAHLVSFLEFGFCMMINVNENQFKQSLPLWRMRKTSLKGKPIIIFWIGEKYFKDQFTPGLQLFEPHHPLPSKRRVRPPAIYSQQLVGLLLQLV